MCARKLLAGLAVACLAGWSAQGLGLPSDRLQAIEIESRQAVREEATGITVYSGDVTIVQGTIRIDADKVTVHTQDNRVTRIVCEGRPARYQQQPETDSGLVIARGNSIQYDLGTDVILLLGAASLEQDDATLTGERIEYELEREVIRATGGSESGSERIRMVIPPSQQTETVPSQQPETE